MKQNNPNNPSHTDAAKQRPKPRRRSHSGDRFITQAKANFDKQLGTISPNLWIILRAQSGGRGESGGNEEMCHHCAHGKKKKTCSEKKKKCFNYN